jgi:hypothetical protein
MVRPVGDYGRLMHPVILVLAVVASLGAAAVIVHLALTMADRKGWVYYRNPQRRPPRSLGLLEEIYQPSITHVIDHEIEEDSVADTTESGDRPDPGRTGPSED